MCHYMPVVLLTIACLALVPLAQTTEGHAELRKMQDILEVLQTERKGKGTASSGSLKKLN